MKKILKQRIGLLRCELIEEAKEVIARMQNVYEVSLLDGEFGERRREILETEPGLFFFLIFYLNNYFGGIFNNQMNTTQ